VTRAPAQPCGWIGPVVSSAVLVLVAWLAFASRREPEARFGEPELRFHLNRDASTDCTVVVRVFNNGNADLLVMGARESTHDRIFAELEGGLVESGNALYSCWAPPAELILAPGATGLVSTRGRVERPGVPLRIRFAVPGWSPEPWWRKRAVALFRHVRLGAGIDTWILRNLITVHPRLIHSPWYEVDVPDLDPFT